MHVVRKSHELSQEERRAIERLLGRTLRDGEAVTVSALMDDTAEKPRATLPKWPGRVVGSLSRRDLYDDGC